MSEDPRHPDHYAPNPFFGEMGQVIEWLIFGHVVDKNIYRPGVLEVTCWNAYPGQGDNAITINSFSGARMLAIRPPRRMGAADLRVFMANMATEENAASGPQPDPNPDLADLDMPDVDSEYSGHQIADYNIVYRRGVQRVRAESRRPRSGPGLVQPFMPRTVYERRPVDGPFGPPGVIRRFLNTGQIAFAVLSVFALYLGLGSNLPDLGYVRRTATNIMASFDLVIFPFMLFFFIALLLKLLVIRVLRRLGF